MNISMKCYNYDAQPSGGIKRRRNEEQIIIKTNTTYKYAHKIFSVEQQIHLMYVSAIYKLTDTALIY